MTNKNKMEKQSEKFIWIFFCGFANGYLPYRFAIICGRVTCDCFGLGAEPWNPEKNDNHSYHLLPVAHFFGQGTKWVSKSTCTSWRNGKYQVPGSFTQCNIAIFQMGHVNHGNFRRATSAAPNWHFGSLHRRWWWPRTAPG